MAEQIVIQMDREAAERAQSALSVHVRPVYVKQELSVCVEQCDRAIDALRDSLDSPAEWRCPICKRRNAATEATCYLCGGRSPRPASLDSERTE